MGYLHIENLYKNGDILLFKECYAMEKIHGSSAHISWKEGQVNYNSGGEKHERVLKIFNQEAIKAKFVELFAEKETVIFGEVYGGKCQGMSETYGKELKFVAFDVKVGDDWLNVKDAAGIVASFGLEFVAYEVIPSNLEAINAVLNKDSEQAIRNGMGQGKMREGIVLRPMIEVKKNNGSRVIAKHKHDEFMETATPREVDPAHLKLLEDAQAIATEWVTPMRLSHVLDKLGNPTDIKDISKVIKAMQEDVLREAKGEIVETQEARRAIGTRAALLFKSRLGIIP